MAKGWSESKSSVGAAQPIVNIRSEWQLKFLGDEYFLNQQPPLNPLGFQRKRVGYREAIISIFLLDSVADLSKIPPRPRRFHCKEAYLSCYFPGPDFPFRRSLYPVFRPQISASVAVIPGLEPTEKPRQ